MKKDNIIFPKTFPVTGHTNYVGPGSTFIAIKGEKQNGIDYIARALTRGAINIVVQQDVELSGELIWLIKKNNAVLTQVENARLTLAQLSAQAAGYPSRLVKIIGITGTKGKTTTSFLLEHMLKTAGYKTALLSTIKNKILDTDFKAELTTHQPDYLHQFFMLCVKNGVEYVVMEVAAQALSLHRVATIEFDGIIFTNFAQEHAEFYASMEEYFAAKCLIFEQIKSNTPVLINADDEWLNDYVFSNTVIYTYSLHKRDAFFCAYDYEIYPFLTFVFKSNHLKANKQYRFECPYIIGQFNIYNCLAASSMATSLGVSPESIQRALQSFKPLPGRLDRYQLPNGALCFIDYAHNPSSYQAVLSLLKKITNHLIVVFGAGGNKDKTKRPMMGCIASQYADILVLTSDNPRTEDPQAILNDILVGISPQKRVICELDREIAITIAYRLSHSGSVIAVLGKGPDEYQIIGATFHYFSDKKVVLSLR
ncbi:UDP-N-acetylmuramoyl-L-alanyl-D-glutamate--2,6-diaminopimelate ligase [Candidatus Dependentiae bacterium]|nr:UDP-N-acetylmuramoyl-L-alanyl-D-glutamate--2,6-diaminopimelate ligase [Candidatus Dependentiae bacterium]